MDAPVVAAAISASMTVVVAVGTTISARRQRVSERRVERQVTFVLAAQDAALELRDVLRRYGTTLRSGADLADVDHDRLVAEGRFDVARSRVRDRGSRRRWRAGRPPLGCLDDPLDASAAKEDAAFEQLNAAVVAVLATARG